MSKANIATCVLDFTFGALAQLARALALHARGQEFDSPRLHHIFISMPLIYYFGCNLTRLCLQINDLDD